MCLPNMCLVPPPPTRGTYGADVQHATHGDALAVSCDPGFAPFPPEPAECHCPVSGEMCSMSAVVECSGVLCNVPALDNGVYSAIETQHLSVVHVTCDPGFRRTGSARLECQCYEAGGTCELIPEAQHEDLPQCVETTCSLPQLFNGEWGSPVAANGEDVEVTCVAAPGLDVAKVEALAVKELGT